MKEWGSLYTGVYGTVSIIIKETKGIIKKEITGDYSFSNGMVVPIPELVCNS